MEKINLKNYIDFNIFLIYVFYFFQSNNIRQNLILTNFIIYRDGSHGLDLSYVTHIFLMDTVLDNSLLQQVVSRAYRMGCRQSVIVNQLIMKGTIEEIIYKYILLKY